MSKSRRDVLQSLALGTLGLGALPSLAEAAPRRDVVAGGSGAIEELRAGAAAAPFDTSWTAKLTGKYRAVFDVPEIESGVGVLRAGLWRTHYADTLQAAPADINPVIVIRHNAIPCIMSHEFWETYKVGKAEKVTHPMTEKPTTRNVALLGEADGMPKPWAAYALDRQLAAGTIVLACAMAYQRMMGMVAKQDRITPAQAREKVAPMMLPGVILQPNGIFGVTLAQQHGCAFVNAV